SIHDPSHDSGICSYIRCRNILFRSDQRSDCCGITSCDSPDFVFGKFGWITDNAAFAAAVRDVDNSAFKSHPCSERAYFVCIDVRMETNASFCRTSGSGVLDPVPLEYMC